MSEQQAATQCECHKTKPLFHSEEGFYFVGFNHERLFAAHCIWNDSKNLVLKSPERNRSFFINCK